MRDVILVADAGAGGRFARLRRCIKSFVESRHVQRAILVAIMLNSISMGIEYHNQVITTSHHLVLYRVRLLSLLQLIAETVAAKIAPYIQQWNHCIEYANVYILFFAHLYKKINCVTN